MATLTDAQLKQLRDAGVIKTLEEVADQVIDLFPDGATAPEELVNLLAIQTIIMVRDIEARTR